MAKPGANLQQVLYSFALRFIGSLAEWYHGLGEYRQLQFIQAASIDLVLNVIHREFMGSDTNTLEEARHEFFERRCCSYERQDMYHHYKEMLKLYHLLVGPDDPTLKHAFIKSFNKELLEETFRLIKLKNKE